MTGLGNRSPAIVVGCNRHPASLSALGTAARLGQPLDAVLSVIHAIDLADYPIDPDSPDWEEHCERTLRAVFEK